MDYNNYINRIENNPKILGGQTIIKGTRIPVSLILNLLANGYAIDRVLEAYPNLEREDILAAIRYSAIHMERERVLPLELAH